MFDGKRCSVVSKSYFSEENKRGNVLPVVKEKNNWFWRRKAHTKIRSGDQSKGRMTQTRRLTKARITEIKAPTSNTMKSFSQWYHKPYSISEWTVTFHNYTTVAIALCDPFSWSSMSDTFVVVCSNRSVRLASEPGCKGYHSHSAASFWIFASPHIS